MSVTIVLKNNTASKALYAHVTGTDGKGLFLLGSDGSTTVHPASPSGTLHPVGSECAINIGSSGKSRTLTIPYLSGARIWFCKDKPLQFFLNPGPALVEPSPTNTADPNYESDWGFCELTYNSDQIYVNISFVDFVSLPISIQLENASGTKTKVSGLPPQGLADICSGLISQGQKDGKGWDKLVVKNKSGQYLRALSPNSGAVLIPGLFNNYFQSYVDQCWDQYSKEDLTVDTQYTWGNVKGRVSNGKLTFPNVGSFSKPSAVDIFSCNSGPFANVAGVSQEVLNIGARLAAALNRSTLLTNANQPEGEKVTNYYKQSITNHYARICHEVSEGGRGYAFPYDDVGASSGEDQSGFLNDPKPKVLTVSVGKPF